MNHNESVKKNKGKNVYRSVKRMARVIFLVFLFITIIAGGWGLKTGMTMYANADISKLGQEPPRSTIIYDRYGDVITELTNAQIEYVPLAEIPIMMQDAIVAIEDVRFYEHDGVDVYAIARALYEDVKAGKVVQGGSTITQQLAKNMLFTSEQTLTRKVNEAVASLKIEKTYSKEEIMEKYLNHIYFGEGAWGIERAANEYFGKEAKDMTLAECALLAGLPKAPTSYSPADYPTKAKERRNLVLKMMVEHSKITIEQRDQAIAEEIVLAEKSTVNEASKYHSYVYHVIDESIEKYGLTQEEVLTNGLHIYTNLDPKVQEAAETVYKEDSLFPKSKEDQQIQSGIVMMDSKTGAIRAIVGQRGERDGFRTMNYATQLSRQPGSAIKPIIVYAPALKAGYRPFDLINDVETDFGHYKPNNYGNKFHGWVTIEEALIQSYNVPAVALLKEIGIDYAMEFAKGAGLPLGNEDRKLGIALGGLNMGTSPLQMAQAYTMFPNGGKKSEAYAITKITNHQDKVIAEAKPEHTEMIDRDSAYEMTLMMQKVVTEGTGRAARFERPMAGKTGTTQLPSTAEFESIINSRNDAAKDAWFVGYTPSLVGAVWIGYEHTDSEHYLVSHDGLSPSGVTARIFKEVMKRALKGEPVEKFVAPAHYRPEKGRAKLINGTIEAKKFGNPKKKNKPRKKKHDDDDNDDRDEDKESEDKDSGKKKEKKEDD